MDVLDLLLSVACLAVVVIAQPPPTPHPTQHNVLKDHNQVHDQAHIMEHMDGVYKKPEAEMSDQELQFHYFKLHDYDNNNMLDGIELISAITHYHKDEGHNHAPPPILPESQLTSMIDTILREEDGNDDGYISYIEFMSAQQKSNEAATQPPPST